MLRYILTDKKDSCAMDPYDVEAHLSPSCPGLKVVFETAWVIWIQKSNPTDTDYLAVPVYKFRTIAGFWTIMNHLKICHRVRITFMRDGIRPEWEDPRHKNGAYYTITLQKSKPCMGRKIPSENDQNEIFIQYLLGIIGETFTKREYESNNITGITYITHPTTKKLRLWLADSSHPLGETSISPEYLNMLKTFSSDLSTITTLITFESLEKQEACSPRKKY